MFFKRQFFKLPLYIFFLYFVIFFIKFSTVSFADNFYKVTDIEISEEFKLNFNKNKTIDKAINKGFKELLKKITISTQQEKLGKIKFSSIKNLVDSFVIIDEKFVDNKYYAKFEIEFNKKNVNNILENKNIFPSIPIKKKLFIMPILVKNDQYEVSLFSENPFYLNWNKENKKYHLIKYILPNEDIEDINLIRKKANDLEKYNFEKIIEKYDLNDFIIIVFFQNKNELNALSKIYFNKNYKILNSKFTNFDIYNLDSIQNVIYKLKTNYENEWKKNNQINSSINLTITLSLDSRKYDIINKLEEKLGSLDLVSNYYIDRFSEDKTIYKITYNSTPDKFIDEIISEDFELDTTSSTWLIK